MFHLNNVLLDAAIPPQVTEIPAPPRAADYSGSIIVIIVLIVAAAAAAILEIRAVRKRKRGDEGEQR